MKIEILTLVAALTFGSAGLAEHAHASPSQFFPMFPTSCAQQAYAGYVMFRNQPSVIGNSYINSGEAWSDQVLYAGQLKDNIDSFALILISMASRGEDKKVTTQQRLAARRILSDYERKVSFSGFLLDPGEAPSTSGTLTFNCFTETCPRGSQCVTVSPRVKAQEALATLPTRRRFFNRNMRWARGVEHLKSKVNSFKATYDNAEVEVRSALASVPNEVFRIDATIEN